MSNTMNQILDNMDHEYGDNMDHEYGEQYESESYYPYDYDAYCALLAVRVSPLVPSLPTETVSVRRYVDHVTHVTCNMRNSFKTPTGMYFYIPGRESAFGQSRPFVIEGSITGRVVNLEQFSDWHYAEERLSQLKERFPDHPHIDLLVNAALTNKSEIIESHFKWYKITERADGQQLAAVWWALLREIAHQNVNKWSKALVSLGVDIVVDPGYGIIHNLEPTQVWARPGVKRRFIVKENNKFNNIFIDINNIKCEMRKTYLAVLLGFNSFKLSPADVYAGGLAQRPWRQVGMIPLQEGEWTVGKGIKQISIEIYKQGDRWEWKKYKVWKDEGHDDRDPFEDNSWW